MPEQSDPKSQPTENYVFISYAREDQEYARKLADDLHEHDFRVWIDDRIDFGDRWWQTIVKAIRHSAAFVVIMTPDSEDSEWVEREILLAQRERKPIFPLLFRGQEFPLLITTQYVDVTNGQLPSNKFYQRLGRVVSSKPKTEKRPTRPVIPSQPRQKISLSTLQTFEPELILIPAGEFLMGSDPKKDKHAQDDEQPQHTLYLPDYYMAKTPVTNAQYRRFVEETNHRQPNHWKNGQPPSGEQDHPVVNVSRHDAVAYCHWLTEKTGRTYRLPMEAEWEKAARGTDGRIYSWGNQWDAKQCNTKEGGQGGTTPVGTYPNGASPYGVLDMVGNVWERCATKWQKSYPYDAEENEWSPGYLEGDALRVLRGGAWYDYRRYARCAARLRGGPFSWVDYFGFRVLVSPSSPPSAR